MKGIQKSVLNGRLGEAIELTYQLFPGILERNPNLLFALKVRQFIEMINQATTRPNNHSTDNNDGESTTQNHHNHSNHVNSSQQNGVVQNSSSANNSNINTSTLNSETMDGANNNLATMIVDSDEPSAAKVKNGFTAENGIEDNETYKNHCNNNTNEEAMGNLIILSYHCYQNLINSNDYSYYSSL